MYNVDKRKFIYCILWVNFSVILVKSNMMFKSDIYKHLIYCISLSNNWRQLFQILLTGSCALNILLYFPIKKKDNDI